MGMCLRAKFEVSRIILTGFRQGVGNFTPPPQNEPLKSPPRLGLSEVTLYFRCAQFNRLLYHTDCSSVLNSGGSKKGMFQTVGDV